MDATHANGLAYLVLFLWPLVALALFAYFRPPLAAALVYLTAALFLPERVQFDLPAVPPLSKHSMTSLCVLAGLLWRGRAELVRARAGRGLDLLIGIMMLGSIATAVTNTDPLHYGPTTLHAMSFQDAAAFAFHDLLYVGVPFIVGRVLYRDRASVHDLFAALAVIALIYSAFVLVELRMSPQWHKWIYGFHQHVFGQAFRWGGWRPMVFMGHGLALAMVFLIAALAAIALSRAGQRVWGISAGALAAWFTVILVLCKSTAAIAYGLLLIPAALWLRPRRQLFIGLALAVVVVAYPLMRFNGLFPTVTLTSWAASLSAERAESVQFRFFHEDRLMGKAEERPLFGWGGYRRNRVFDDQGRDRSVTDGFWILQLGIRGILGFVAAFGLLLIPLLLARRHWHAVSASDRWSLTALAAIVAIYSIDLIPNGLFNVFPFFFAGALAGAATGLAEQPEAEPVATASLPRPVTRAPESLY
jgi:hypothetical protein